MTKLNKTQLKERDELAGQLRDRRDDLEKAIDTWNETCTNMWSDDMVPALEAFNDAIREANEWRANIAGDIQTHYDEKSENWQNGDKGNAVSSWQSEMEGEFDEATFETPEPLDMSDIGDPAEELEQLPEQADC